MGNRLEGPNPRSFSRLRAIAQAYLGTPTRARVFHAFLGSSLHASLVLGVVAAFLLVGF